MPDSDPQQTLLYEIAQQARNKAMPAYRRKKKRIARQAAQARQVLAPANAMASRRSGTTDRQQRGQWCENQAAQHLRTQGMLILARNIHCRTGEIDLVATDRTTLIFVEVRYRKSHQYGGAAASVSRAKQLRLMRTAQFFLPQLCARHFAGRLPPCRFDVICIDNNSLHWIRHAFEPARS